VVSRATRIWPRSFRARHATAQTPRKGAYSPRGSRLRCSANQSAAMRATTSRAPGSSNASTCPILQREPRMIGFSDRHLVDRNRSIGGAHSLRGAYSKRSPFSRCRGRCSIRANRRSARGTGGRTLCADAVGRRKDFPASAWRVGGGPDPSRGQPPIGAARSIGTISIANRCSRPPWS
jgi:hypothetical protein